jgi:hypothetical protein
MANRTTCIHGLHRQDAHGVCADCEGLTRVTGAVVKDTGGRHRGGRFTKLRGRAKAGTCRRCGEPSTMKESVSDILRPWCDGCRKDAVKALRAGGAVTLKNLDVFFELRRAGNSRRATMGEHIGEGA